jgi:hypothetical protein
MPIAASTLMVETEFGRRTLVKRGITKPVVIAASAYRNGVTHGRIRADGKLYVNLFFRDFVEVIRPQFESSRKNRSG